MLVLMVSDGGFRDGASVTSTVSTEVFFQILSRLPFCDRKSAVLRLLVLIPADQTSGQRFRHWRGHGGEGAQGQVPLFWMGPIVKKFVGR